MIKIDDSLCEKIQTKALSADRKRMNHNFHNSFNDPLQRFLNALEPDSYIQPHKHSEPMKTELFILLKGSVLVLEYDDSGNVVDESILCHAKGNYGIEIEADKWHSCIALESGTVFYEVKAGPYCPPDKIMAPWAPEEGSPESKKFIVGILNRSNYA